MLGKGCSLQSSLSTDSLREPNVCCVQVVAGVLEELPSDTTLCGGSGLLHRVPGARPGVR